VTLEFRIASRVTTRPGAGNAIAYLRRMNLTPTEKERLFEVCKIIWPDAGMDENGEIFVPFSVGAHVSPGETRAARRPRRPSSDELPALVVNA
jgi:hypothetical protein